MTKPIWASRTAICGPIPSAATRPASSTISVPNRPAGSDGGTADVFAPGISLNDDLTDSTALFAGYCRGFSNPAPREFLKGDAQMELTDGFELGARYAGSSVQAQRTGFYTSFHDMVANEGLGGLGTIEDSNAGDARLSGIEGAIRWDPLQESRGDWRLPLRGFATWTPQSAPAGRPGRAAQMVAVGITQPSK